MNNDTFLHLPEDLCPSLLCSVLHHTDYVSAITTCHSNGFIYELKNKKIVGSFNTKEKMIHSLSVYYFYECCKLIVYYVILTVDNKLLIVKRTKHTFQITFTVDNVNQFSVFDFNILGFPQIKITLLNSPESSIFEFLSDQNFRKLIRSEMKYFYSNYKNNCLRQNLLIINKHIDTLTEENFLIKKNITNNVNSNEDFMMLPIKQIKFSSELGKIPKSKLIVCRKWHRNFGKLLVFGIRIVNCSDQIIPDLELFIKQEHLVKFTYCFFLKPDIGQECWPEKAFSSIQPGQEILAVGVFQMPSLILESEISIQCLLISLETQINLLIDFMNVNAVEAFTKTKSEFTVDHVLAMRTSQIETRLFIEVETNENNSLEDKFSDKLGLEKMDFGKITLFYSISDCFGVALELISACPITWKAYLYTSDYSQVYLFVNALYDLLPEKTTILYCEE